MKKDFKLAEKQRDPWRAGHRSSEQLRRQKQAPLTIHEMSGGLQMGARCY